MDSELDARATSTADEQASSRALVGEEREREASPASSSAGPAWSPSESSSPESYDAQPAVLRSGCPRPSSRSTTIERTRESITCGRGAGEGRCRCEGWRWLAGGGRTGKWAGRGWAEGGLAVGEHREAKGVHGHHPLELDGRLHVATTIIIIIIFIIVIATSSQTITGENTHNWGSGGRLHVALNVVLGGSERLVDRLAQTAAATRAGLTSGMDGEPPIVVGRGAAAPTRARHLGRAVGRGLLQLRREGGGRSGREGGEGGTGRGRKQSESGAVRAGMLRGDAALRC